MNGPLFRYFEERNPDGTYKWGLEFNDQGEITNGTDVLLKILADTPPGGTIGWQTAWWHTRPVQISQRVNLEGAISAPILVNMPDPANDIALLVKGLGVPQDGNTFYPGPAYFTHRFVMLGGNAPDYDTPVCLHGVQYFFCAQAQVIAHIRLPCTGWGLVSSGNLYGEFELTMSTNHPYYNQNGTPILTGMPYRGLWACPADIVVDPNGGTVAQSGNNNTSFHLHFAAARALIEDGIAQSDLQLSGSIESGYPAQYSGDDRSLILSGLTVARVHDLHYEANAGPLTVQNCLAPLLENVSLWGGANQLPGIVLDLDGCINATLQNVFLDELLIRPNCDRTQVGAVVYGIQGGGIKDYSPSTRFVVAPNLAAGRTPAATGAGDGTSRNLVPNGDFEKELDYTPVGTAPETVERTDDPAALFRFERGYRLTSTAAAGEQRMIEVAIPDVDQHGNAMDFTFWAWVKWVSSPPPADAVFVVQGFDSSGGAVLAGGQLYPDAPGWVRIATRGKVSGVPSFRMGGTGPFDVYVGEIGATYGQTAPAGWVP